MENVFCGRPPSGSRRRCSPPWLQELPAAPSSGVTANQLFKHTFGDIDFVGMEVTIQPGGSTGWHFHDGTVVGVITAGTLTRYDGNCELVGLHPMGATVYEPPGTENVHIGMNLGTEPTVLKVLYLLPKGSPLSQDVAAPPWCWAPADLFHTEASPQCVSRPTSAA